MMTAPLPDKTKLLESEVARRYRTQRNALALDHTTAKRPNVALPVLPDQAYFASHQRVVLELETVPKVTFVLNPIYAVLIGRNDDHSLTQPAIDLAPYNAQQYGVSRAHAVIRRYGDNLWLNDLGSRNGTYINKVKLQPFATYRLCHGDELVLGSLKVQILFREGEAISEERGAQLVEQPVDNDGQAWVS
jgi:hypothetical protein